MRNDLFELVRIIRIVAVPPHGAQEPIEMFGENKLWHTAWIGHFLLVGYHLHILLELLSDKEVS